MSLSNDEYFPQHWTRREFVGAACCATISMLTEPAQSDESKIASDTGEWKMYRRDQEFSAESPLRGGLAAESKVVWKMDFEEPKVLE